MKLFDTTFGALNKALDLTFKRHAVLSGNVANAETPGYVAREIDFAGELAAAIGNKEEVLTTTNARHMDTSRAQAAHITHDYSGPTKADGNNVDLDLAMGKLSANSRAYQNATTLLSLKLAMLRAATQVRGG